MGGTERSAERLIGCGNALGEGPLWHAASGRLYWFDIDNHTLFAADASGSMIGQWRRERPISAAAIIDDQSMLVAGAEGLMKFDPIAGFGEKLSELEPASTGNRSNDGRVGPGGVFWIGTMNMSNPDHNASGAIYGYKAGEVRVLHPDIHIPNSICFSPDGRTAYFTDTVRGIIMKQALDLETGWPLGPAEPLIDTNDLPGGPDGSVVDANGCIWNARWGGSAVIRITPDGKVDQLVHVPTPKVTCPAFGGTDLKTMFITTAGGDGPDSESGAGDVYAIDLDVSGLSERAVIA